MTADENTTLNELIIEIRELKLLMTETRKPKPKKKETKEEITQRLVAKIRVAAKPKG